MTLNYGAFINTLVNLVIVGFVIFLLVKGVNAARKPAAGAARRDARRRRAAARDPRRAEEVEGQRARSSSLAAGAAVHHLAADDGVGDLGGGDLVFRHRQDVLGQHGDVGQLAHGQRALERSSFAA